MMRRRPCPEWPEDADRLTLAALSRLTAIHVGDLSRYRTGDKGMSDHTRERVRLAAEVEPDSTLVRSHAPTLAQVAMMVRANAEPVDVLSVLARALQQARRFESLAELRAFEARPPKTGIPGWDRLLAGVAEDFHFTSILRDEPQPPWTLERASLPRWWSPFDYGTRFSWAFLRTPLSLRERGVVLNRGELETV